MAHEVIYRVRNLRKHFEVQEGLIRRRKRFIRAVDGVDLVIRQGETLGLVGESGCGKTTLGLCLLRILEPTGGELQFGADPPVNVEQLRGRELLTVRRKMQIVFQDPVSSLNPRLIVRDIVREPLQVVLGMNGAELNDRVVSLMRDVGLGTEHVYRYPHELSGGQKQRVAVARALALNPEFIVLDEPTSSLDVSVQAQVIELLKGLQLKFGLSYLFITHNLGVLRQIADRVAVMYAGKIVEVAESESLFDDPMHPYTQVLLSAVPRPNPKERLRAVPLKGEVPSSERPPAGCRFHPRCPRAFRDCGWEPLDLVERFRGFKGVDWTVTGHVSGSTDPRGALLEIKMRGSEPAIRAATAALLDAIDEGRKREDPLFQVVKVEPTITSETAVLRITCPPASEPKLTSLSGQREVACFLYSDPEVTSGG